MFGGVFDSASIDKSISDNEKLKEATGFWNNDEEREQEMAKIRKLKYSV